MTVEQITYDFSDHQEYFKTFFIRIIRLIIISKLNCIESNDSSLNYYYQIVKQIEGCETHKKRYGKPMVFTKFLGYAFTYHTIDVSIKVVDKYVVDILLQSAFSDFVKVFDRLSMDIESNNIRWNISYEEDKALEKIQESKLQNDSDHDVKISRKEKKTPNKNIDDENDIPGTFSLLDSLIESLYILISLPQSDPNSLIGKNFEIRDVSVSRKSINIEFLINESPIIMIIAPKKRKNKISIIMDNDNNIGNTTKEIMLQHHNF